MNYSKDIEITSEEDVSSFLKALKSLVENSAVRIAPRNYPHMQRLGINIEGVFIILLSLTIANYSEGPMNDRNDYLEGQVCIERHMRVN